MASWELNSTVSLPEGRENVCLSEDAKSRFSEYVRKYGNGLMNSNGGVVYFGLTSSRVVRGISLSRKEEDELRLVVDRTFGSFQPLVSMANYRLSFVPVCHKGRETSYRVVELKVSIGQIGEIYEDGVMNVFLVDEGVLIGPLYPQEIKELVLLKYKEAVEGAEDARRFMTPCIQMCKDKAKKEACGAKTGIAIEAVPKTRALGSAQSSSSILHIDLTQSSPVRPVITGSTAQLNGASRDGHNGRFRDGKENSAWHSENTSAQQNDFVVSPNIRNRQLNAAQPLGYFDGNARNSALARFFRPTSGLPNVAVGAMYNPQTAWNGTQQVATYHRNFLNGFFK